MCLGRHSFPVKTLLYSKNPTYSSYEMQGHYSKYQAKEEENPLYSRKAHNGASIKGKTLEIVSQPRPKKK